MPNGIIQFNNANSRDTYFTVHNVKEAHKINKGKGVKVGVIDWSFGINHNQSLYSGSVDLAGEPKELYEYEGHGLWMATVLKEIAPECEIFAINAVFYEDGKSIEEQDDKRSKLLIRAIDWAVENKVDILTYSQSKFSDKYLVEVDDAINYAVENGIITAFIHCDNPNNIYPYGCLRFANDQKFRREPDVNIFHFDYNTLFIEQYEKYETSIRNNETIRSGNDLPYFSFSSMSPVLGGFVAILKSLRPSLSSQECKDILIKTSYEILENGEQWYDLNPCPHVVDIGKAVQYLLSNKCIVEENE